MYKLFVKRILDFFISLIGIIVLSPIWLVLIVVLSVTNNGKPFFFQKRPGKNERIFKIMKFKSMTDKKDENGELLPYQDRITKVGLFIRKYSLDEIPQLFNVLLGDMSLVGPRPLLPKYLPLYNEEQKQRHLVKPGITGWAQVKGRNAISWEEKFKLDVWYVNNLSFLLDLKIILLTVKRVIIPQGINQSNNINMPEFKGTTNE